MKIVEDFIDKSYNNNGKFRKSHWVLRVKPKKLKKSSEISIFLIFLHCQFVFYFSFFFVLHYSSFSIFSFFPFDFFYVFIFLSLSFLFDFLIVFSIVLKI